MAAKKRSAPALDPAVNAFMKDLDHPLKREVELVREIILGVSPDIREAIKWNAPSFRTSEFFATTHLRTRDRLQLVFHLGAKVKEAPSAMEIPDPEGLMKWLAKDRCLVTLGTGKEIEARRHALTAIVRAWIHYLPPAP